MYDAMDTFKKVIDHIIMFCSSITLKILHKRGSNSPSKKQDGKNETVHIIGSSVNLPDMTATLKAKVSISDADQADPKAIAAAYDAMAEKFVSNGLNIDAITQMRQYFTNLDGPGNAEPLFYSDFPAPLPPRAVRLCVSFLQNSNAVLAKMVFEAAQEIMMSLPSNTKYHINNPEHYHITIYMTSQPHTLRPDPFDPNRPLPTRESSPEEVYDLVNPDPSTIEKEIEVIRNAAKSIAPPTFRVHRLVMADSGTLLLCSMDTSGTLAKLRKDLRESFPAGPPRQSTIYHASLARIVTPQQLDKESIRKVHALCDKWSAVLAGNEFCVDALHHVSEERFTTVEGPAIRVPFKAPLNS